MLSSVALPEPKDSAQLWGVVMSLITGESHVIAPSFL
jgi:hypothetical protein